MDHGFFFKENELSKCDFFGPIRFSYLKGIKINKKKTKLNHFEPIYGHLFGQRPEGPMPIGKIGIFYFGL